MTESLQHQLRQVRNNPKTTTLGALAGAAIYGGNVGLKLPANQEEWISLLIALAIAALGWMAQDASEPSKDDPEKPSS